jgi:hypothetical protein
MNGTFGMATLAFWFNDVSPLRYLSKTLRQLFALYDELLPSYLALMLV